jgi:hypothetical protein
LRLHGAKVVRGGPDIFGECAAKVVERSSGRVFVLRLSDFIA